MPSLSKVAAWKLQNFIQILLLIWTLEPSEKSWNTSDNDKEVQRSLIEVHNIIC
jgi:hypothetical protein